MKKRRCVCVLAAMWLMALTPARAAITVIDPLISVAGVSQQTLAE